MFTPFKIIMASVGVVAMLGTKSTTTITPNEIPAYQPRHADLIQRLIKCESGGVNITKPDSDGVLSDGILQFHRGKGDNIDTGTWGEWSRKSGIKGSPLIPEDAIKMADWALDHGLARHWSCAHVKNNWRLPLKPEFQKLEMK